MFKKIIILYEKNDLVNDLIVSIANDLNIITEKIDYNHKNLTILNEKIIIDEKVLTYDDNYFFLINISDQYPFIPSDVSNIDFMYFIDDYLEYEQKKSHFISLVSLVSQKYKCINNYNTTKFFLNKYYSLNFLKNMGLNTPYFLTGNDISLLKNSQILKYPEILWSELNHNSPFKKISTTDLNQLIKKDIPLLLCENKEGEDVRLFFFRNKPLTALTVNHPVYNNEIKRLEQYTVIKEIKFLESLANLIYEKCQLDYYEIYGSVENDILWIYGLRTDIYSSSLPEKILLKILSLIIKDALSIESIKDEKYNLDNIIERDSLFLKVMLKKYF